jgi:fructose-1,6-bisphosphatase-3
MSKSESFDQQSLTQCLRALGRSYPNVESALAEIAHLRAVLTLPKGTIHIVSDVHGEFKKLRHIINNGSGSLRPLVEQVFGERIPAADKVQLLSLIYYPRETYAHVRPTLTSSVRRREFLSHTLALAFEVLRELITRYSFQRAESLFPPQHARLFKEFLYAKELRRSPDYLEQLLDPFLVHDNELELLRHVAHVIRNLSIAELIVAGDLGDRGPRIDKVIDYIMKQPSVAITWGNHDASWMGACLGQEALIATVLRISLRYRRLSQLEEGYGIIVAPLEKLAREVYADDPADRFHCKGEGLRDPQLMARMQKAIAIMQFKLEGQTARRHPEWNLESRNLLHRIDPREGTVEIDGKRYPLLDKALPTVDWSDPYKLSAEEETCMARLRQSFTSSNVLWKQMSYVAQKGAMWLTRDANLIFHGATPIDESGAFLKMPVAGTELGGRALYDALNVAVHKAFRTKAQMDTDLLWYLWTGPLSPLFGKDRMATFETYFVADKETHKETKNPYFKKIHTKDFCKKVFAEFGVDPEHGLIVNGHVPVKVEKGENPVKEGGMAVTIDGAFSEAYGDKGYTLVLDAGRTYLAQHHHFESVDEAITQGSDIIPRVQDIRVFERVRTVDETEAGEDMRGQIALLELLIRAYQENVFPEQS